MTEPTIVTGTSVPGELEKAHRLIGLHQEREARMEADNERLRDALRDLIDVTSAAVTINGMPQGAQASMTRFTYEWERAREAARARAVVALEGNQP